MAAQARRDALTLAQFSQCIETSVAATWSKPNAAEAKKYRTKLMEAAGMKTNKPDLRKNRARAAAAFRRAGMGV